MKNIKVVDDIVNKGGLVKKSMNNSVVVRNGSGYPIIQ